jgi:hypothetical protein
MGEPVVLGVLFLCGTADALLITMYGVQQGRLRQYCGIVQWVFWALLKCSSGCSAAEAEAVLYIGFLLDVFDTVNVAGCHVVWYMHGMVATVVLVLFGVHLCMMSVL